MNSNLKRSERSRGNAPGRRLDDGDAFLPDPNRTNQTEHALLTKTDGESFAEEFIASATAGEPVEMEAQDEVVEEEWGGPFLELEAEGTDGSDAIPEPPRIHKLPPRLQ